VVENPPGLSTIAYRVDDFAGFRRALLEPGEGGSSLLGWHPTSTDLGLQMLEWWAYLADILTFYNERIANEDYLRTAELAASITGLVALLGYQPRPAIGAVGQLAAIRGNAHSHEALTIPAGMKVANTATPGVPAQTFETNAASSFEGHSNVAVELQPSPGLLSEAPGALGSVLLRGNVTRLKVGEQLWALPRSWSSTKPEDNRWAKLTIVESHSEQDPSGAKNTRVVVNASGDDTTGDLLWLLVAQPDEVRLVRATQAAALWTQTAEPATQAFSEAKEHVLKVNLAGVVSAIAPNDVVLLDGARTNAAGLVTEATQSFLGVKYPPTPPKPPVPSIAVAHTELTLSTSFLSTELSKLGAAAEVVLRFGLRDVGTPIGTPATKLEKLPITVTPAPGLTLGAGVSEAFLEDATGTGIPVLATISGAEVSLAAVPAGSGSPPTPKEFRLLAPLRLLVDLVDISRGTSVTGEMLGTGDAGIAGQSFALQRSPLTYFAEGSEYANTLEITVDGIVWSEVPTFYGQPSAATVFTVTQLPDATSMVRFGDGVNGARLSSGAKILADYRYGAGAARPPAGRLTTILHPQPNLASLRNPFAVWGGADAEQASEVRTNAPASVLTFGRAISAEDYETVAALAPGVARARSCWSWDADAQRTLVKVYVGDDPSAVTAAEQALSGCDDPNRPVAVEQANAIELTVTCTLLVAENRVKSEVQAAAEAALANPEAGFFSPANMSIGQSLYSSQLEAVLLVEGAEAVRGLTVTEAGREIVAGEPIGSTNPGEGAYYVLRASTITVAMAND
jgi:predicted phage baseplate assembly protein